MIVLDEYKKQFSTKGRRTYVRGFVDITVSLFDDFQKNRPIERVCELGGLGRADKPAAWHRASSDNFVETVVDNLILHKLFNTSSEDCIKNAELLGVNVVIVENAYTELAKRLALETIAPNKFDVLVDDAGSTWPMPMDSLPIYKDIIADDGLYITETPDGNGNSLFNVPYTAPERTARLTQLSKNGMVIFDATTFSHSPPDREESNGYSGNQLGIYSPNFEIFKDTINTYKNYIIFGHQWVDHLIK